jgi:abortive infection Abi-like protein
VVVCENSIRRMAPSKKAHLEAVIEKARLFKLCGPSDDPDEQTAVAVGLQYIVTQVQRLATPILPLEAGEKLGSIQVDLGDIYSVYPANATLHSLIPEIEAALEHRDDSLTIVATKSPVRARQIPVAVIAAVSDTFSLRFTHAEIIRIMEESGIAMNPVPQGNRQVATRGWLVHLNKTSSDPIAVLGKVLVELMETDNSRVAEPYNELYDQGRERVNKVLGEYGLSYTRGGYLGSGGSQEIGRTLQSIIRARDLSGLQIEFDRIYENLEADPPAAVTAACALLESLFKTYIEENKLEMPSDQSIRPLWKVVRKGLNLDPAIVADDDLKTILTGLASIVEGTGSLRTHTGSAHGRGKTAYKLKPRHARLAAHAASALASYILEAWASRQ